MRNEELSAQKLLDGKDVLTCETSLQQDLQHQHQIASYSVPFHLFPDLLRPSKNIDLGHREMFNAGLFLLRYRFGERFRARHDPWAGASWVNT
jgi:hypothetical protein